MQLSKASNYIYSISAIRLIETGTYDRAVNITQNIGKLLQNIPEREDKLIINNEILMCIVAMIQCGIPVRTMLYSVTDRLDFWLSSSVLVYRSWMLALRGLNVHTAGYWIHEAGYRIHQVGYRLHQAGYRIHQAGYRIHQSRIQDTSKPDTGYIKPDTSGLNG